MQHFRLRHAKRKIRLSLSREQPLGPDELREAEQCEKTEHRGHEEIRDVMSNMIRRGLDPLEVAEAAQTVASALSVSIEGDVRAGSKLYAAGAALLNAARSRAAA